MFNHMSYIGYNALFCVPFIILIWIRREFFDVLVTKWRPILISTTVLTVYGSIIWPVALKYGCWAYGIDKISGVKILGYVYIDDVMWWLLVSFLLTSYVALSAYYEQQGVDICWRELKGLIKSFVYAFRGFRIITLERNSTVHVAVATFVLLEAILFRISTVQWLFVVVAIAIVLGFEIFNSCVERMASWSSTYTHQRIREIGLIKDAAAGSVLLSAMAAGLVGVMIFFNRLSGELF